LRAHTRTNTDWYGSTHFDMGTQWKPTSDAPDSVEGCCRTKGDVRWTASRVDLVFGSNSELRALAEVYACDNAKDKFVRDSSPLGTR
jgi:catalase-peroxidase